MSKILWPVINRCYCFGDMSKCFCDKMERALLAWNAQDATIPAMTVMQRKYCLDEIQMSEGYSVADYENASDAELAGGVLAVWTYPPVLR